MGVKLVLNSTYSGAASWICIDQLSEYLKKKGYIANKNDFHNYYKYDVVIFMSVDAEIENARAQNPKILVGIADPKLNHHGIEKAIKADFLMVTSVEQRDIFLKYNSNIFIFYMLPDIKEKRKLHKKNNKIILGYHGNKIHLETFYPRISCAISNLAKQYEIELWAMYNIEKLGKWEIGMPDLIKVKHIQWKEENYIKYMSKVDIGLIPNLLPLKNKKKLLIDSMIAPKQFNYDKNDYLVRYKYSSGPGRIYIFSVFHIPVISDFFPSAAQFIIHGRCGYLAYSVEGWYYALDDLCSDYHLRQKMGDYFFNHFKKIASREKTINGFIKYLKNFRKHKKKIKINFEKVSKPCFFIQNLKKYIKKYLYIAKLFTIK